MKERRERERERHDTLKPPLNKPISSPLLLVSVVVLCDGVTRLPSRLHERVIERGLQHVLACVCAPCVYTVGVRGRVGVHRVCV